MHELSDSTWIYIFEELLKSRSLLVDCEHLGDFVEDFEEMLDELRLAISNASDEVKSLEALKHSARLADDEHDDAHRALLKVLEAFTFSGDEPSRALVRVALEHLYPERLAMVNASFAEEVDATELFVTKLQHQVVHEGFAVIREVFPGVDHWSQRCVQCGRALGDAVEALKAQELKTENAEHRDTPELVAVRQQARRLWRLFMQTVNFAYPEGRSDTEALREQLLGRYLREMTG